MTRFHSFAVAGLAASAMMAATFTAPTQAHAGGKEIAGAIVGGIVLGAMINHAANAQPHYVVQQKCWKENQFVGYDQWGRQVFQRVTVCG